MANKKINTNQSKASEAVVSEPAAEVLTEAPVVAEETKAEPAVKKAASKTQMPAVKKTTSEKSEKLVIQVSGKDYDPAELIEKCKAAYRGNTRKQVKSIEVYVNTDERKAYFVINGKAEADYYIDL